LHAVEPDIPLADFNGDDYAGWTATGDAFGSAPASGTLPGQMHVDGFEGKGLVNSFRGGDGSTGTLTSPEFTITRRYLSFLVGGGGHAGRTCVNLLVEGKVVRTIAGPNTAAGGSEQLEPASWDLADLAGKAARLEIVDQERGGWGHINADHFVLTDTKPPSLLKDVRREIVAEKRWLTLPVKKGAKKRVLSVLVDGKVWRALDIELADGEPEWSAVLDITPVRGQSLVVSVDQLRQDSTALERIGQTDTPPDAERLYTEPLRPKFHFSPARGWNNDPNGLVYRDGVWHLFFQHNPYGWDWGNMHWGYATSRDLFHWREQGEALYPDAQGTMFSGSAVVDTRNTAGFAPGKPGEPVANPPLVLMYTAAGNTGLQSRGQGFTQGLAYSLDDGKTWTKYAGNPVLPEITGGNRDPKVVWHAPSSKWVMVLYVERDKKHTIEFFSSPDLKAWTKLSAVEGFYECPDFFELPVEGAAGETRWVLTGASSEYMVGTFDGTTFRPETPKLPGHRGRGFYAAQTWSDVPHNRRVQIGWMQAPSPGMSFNQCLSVPLELALVRTEAGPRLTWRPVSELAALRGEPMVSRGKAGSGTRQGPEEDALDVEYDIGTLADARFVLDIHGLRIFRDVRTNELVFQRIAQGEPATPHPQVPEGGEESSAPSLLRVKLPEPAERVEWTGIAPPTLRVLVDRTTVEVFLGETGTYIPLPFIPDSKSRSVGFSVPNSASHGWEVRVHRIRSAWER
jgi:sucrose-6-phosphate hydrolase SacC (GH32 family)